MRSVLIRPPYRVALLVVLVLVALAAPSPARAGNRRESEHLVQQGVTQLKAGNIVDAIPLLDRAIQADPSNDVAYVARAELSAQSSKYDDAVKKMEKAVQLRPNAVPYLYRLGEYQRKAGAPDAAVKSLESVLKHDPDNAAAWSLLGQIHLERDNPIKAEECLKKAVTLGKGTNLNDQFWLGKARFELGKRSGDFEKLTQAHSDLQAVVGKLETSRQDPYKEASAVLAAVESTQRMALIKKWGLVGGGIALVTALAAIVVLRRRRAMDGPGQERFALDIEASSPGEISAWALRRLCSMTQMPYGVAFISTLEGDEMHPSATVALDPASLRTLHVDVNETPRWLERNDGKPFLFAAEKKEGVFVKAFPDAREQLEPLEMRIGIPLVHQDQILGLAFVGVEKTKDILKLKKLYERIQMDVFRLSLDVASALQRFQESELAYLDVLTRLRSRKYVEENLPRALVDAEDAGRRGAVVIFEYDQYRGLEEQYGEGQAQKMVRTVADEIRVAVPTDDGMLARLDGGRFLAFLPVQTPDQAQAFARRIHELVCKARTSRTLPSPTASVGLAIFPDHGNRADDLFWAAEQTMLGVSASGGNAVALAQAQSTAPPMPSSARPPSLRPHPAAGAPPAPSSGPPPAPSWVSGAAAPSRPAEPASPAAPARAPSWISATPAAPSDSFASRESPFKAPAGGGGAAAPPPPPSPGPSFGVPATQIRSGPPPEPIPPPPPPTPPVDAQARRLLSPATRPGGKLFGRRGDASAPPPPPTVEGPTRRQAPPPPPQLTTPTAPAPTIPVAPPGMPLAPAGAFGAPPPGLEEGDLISPPTVRNLGPLPGGMGFGGPSLLPPPGPPGSTVPRFQSPPTLPSASPPPTGGTPSLPGFGPSQGIAPSRPGALPSSFAPPGGSSPAAPAAPSPRPVHAITPAMRDPRTGFVVAEAMQRFLQEEINWSQAAGESCALVYFRVDDHDRLLAAIGLDQMHEVQGNITSLIQDFLKEGTDIAGCSWDDGFLIILPRTSSRIASNLAQQICFTVGNLYVPGLEERSTISVGIAAYPEHARDGRELTECARHAGLRVQATGGNGIQIFAPA